MNDYKSDRNFYMLILILGVLLNFIVISANDYRMPVKTSSKLDSNMHFSYQENSEIKLWTLSDIYTIKTNKLMFIFSIGDVFILLSSIGLVVCIWKGGKVNLKNKRN